MNHEEAPHGTLAGGRGGYGGLVGAIGVRGVARKTSLPPETVSFPER